MRVWITKYALTQGVFIKEADVEADNGRSRAIVRGGAFGIEIFHGKDFQKTREDAILDVTRRINAAKVSARKKLAALDAIDPSSIVPE